MNRIEKSRVARKQNNVYPWDLDREDYKDFRHSSLRHQRRLMSKIGGMEAAYARDLAHLDCARHMTKYVHREMSDLDLDFLQAGICSATNRKLMTAVGTKSGRILLCSYEDEVKSCDSVKGCALYPDTQVQTTTTALDFNFTGNVLAAGNLSGLYVFDVDYGVQTKAIFMGCPISTIQFQSSSETTVAFGTRMGSLGLCDLRENENENDRATGAANITNTDGYRLATKCHRVTSGPSKMSQVPITSLTFTDPYTIATSCDKNTTIKLWDLRMLSRGSSQSRTLTPCCEKNSLGTYYQRRRLGGVVSIVHDPEQSRLWTLARDGIIEVYNSASVNENLPVHRIEAECKDPERRGLTYNDKIILADSNYIAHSFEGRIFLYEKPRKLHCSAIFRQKLPGKDFCSFSYDPTLRGIMTISDDGHLGCISEKKRTTSSNWNTKPWRPGSEGSYVSTVVGLASEH